VIKLDDFPKILQIEPTNACNFSCSMCLLSAWGDKKRNFLSLEQYKKLAEEAFPHISRVVLYGMGEPLLHKRFLDFLEIARNFLPSEGTISFTTNGSLLNKTKVDYILKNGLVDEIVFSCDTLADYSFSSLGHSLERSKVMNNLNYLLNHEKRKQVKIGIESVVMRSNYKYIEEMVSYFCDKKLDFISISHLYPYKEFIQEETMFTMITSEALSILEEVGDEWRELVLGFSREKFAESMQLAYKRHYKFKDKLLKKERPFSERYSKLIEKAKDKGVLLNISLYLKEKSKLPVLHELEKIFERVKTIAYNKGIQLFLPDIIPSFNERECPYFASKAVVIRSDGEIVPCFKYLYDHSTYLDSHSRESSYHSFGNINKDSLQNIWNSESFSFFRKRLENMNRNIPFCGNCSFSSNNCFYATEGQTDCWGNEPFCSECPYSLNLTKCLL